MLLDAIVTTAPAAAAARAVASPMPELPPMMTNALAGQGHGASSCLAVMTHWDITIARLMTQWVIRIGWGACRDGSRKQAERLRTAALELFLEHGYDNVTVAQITERAG